MTRDELMQIGHDAGFDTSELTGEVIALLECVAEHAEAKERTARQEAQAMAECLDMLRTDLIAAGVVGPEVAPMFLTEAVLSEVSLERTARIEAQMRLHIASLSDAVTAEREACAELMEQQHTWITNVAASALIRARGTPCL